MAAPILQSLLLADHVYRDQATGKHVICGIFSTIFFTPNAPPENPSSHAEGNSPSSGNRTSDGGGSPSGGGGAAASGSPHPDAHSGESSAPKPRSHPIQNLIQAGSPYVYFSVTELHGRKSFEVRYVDLHENRTLFQAEVPVECDDPLKTIEISMPLPRLPLVALEERSYALEVLCEGQLLGSHRVLARISPGSQPPAN